MTGHRTTIDSLYEYLRGELDGSARSRVDEHLAKCEACRAECEEIRSALQIVDSAELDPSAEHSETYWRNFAIRIDQRIAEDAAGRAKRRCSLAEVLGVAGIGGYRTRKIAFGLGVAMLLIAGAFGAWVELRPHAESPQEAEYAVPEQSPQKPIRLVSNDTTNAEMLQYVRRTKMLLVGITNMKAEGEDVDISSEQEKSRALLQQARYLQSQPLDDRSAKLIDELQTILIELANMKEQGNAPNVEILRSGVHHENLLFKIRMEEEKYSHAEKTSPARKKTSVHQQQPDHGHTINEDSI